jgi:hypothetical protein
VDSEQHTEGDNVTRLCNLEPGDMVSMAADPDQPHRTIYIGVVDVHPIYPNMAMYMWYLVDEKRYSFDALHPRTELPAVWTVDTTNRPANLSLALHDAQRMR